MFQSSLEGNPEWNARPNGRAVLCYGFNPHSRETPSGTLWIGPLWPPKWFQSSLEGNPEWNLVGHCGPIQGQYVSILTRGKPRVEPGGVRLHPARARFNPHSRETPSGTLREDGRLLSQHVSILTRGKPRVELEQPDHPLAQLLSFNPHSRETPSGT